MENRSLWLCRLAPALSVALACPAFAQQSANLSPVVITATRSSTSLTDVLADISLIDREQIELAGATSVSDLLARLPGITVSQAGGPFGTTSVFMRGAEGRYTAVFIDGVRLDSQSTGGASWENIPLAQVDHIEVLRGPAAAIYGSDAVGGVVQIFTRQGEPGFFPSVHLGAGSHGTRDASASLRGGHEDVDYALSVASSQSDGFNVKPSGNPDRDGYRNRSFSGRLGWKMRPDQTLDLTVLGNDQSVQYDGSAAPLNDVAQRKLQAIGLNWRLRWADDWRTRVGLTRSTDRYETTPSVYLTETEVSTFLLRNEWGSDMDVLTVDLERREDALQNSSTRPSANTHRSQDAVAVGYGLRSGKHALQVNARQDMDSEFGGKSTGALAYGYTITPNLRVTASTGTAFRAPTLFQRFSLYGTANLRPEASMNHEAGLRWLSGADRASVVVYRNTVDDLINYVSGPGSCINGSGTYPGCYGNTGHARMSGATFEGSTQLGTVHLAGSVDWLSPRNLDTDKWLARRARQQSTWSARTAVAGWQLGGEWQYVGERFDDANNTIRLAPYSLVNLTLGKSLHRDWRFLGRINNLADKHYVLANGYATAGRTLHVGLTWAPL